MTHHEYGYHHMDYEMVKAYQAEVRGVAAQDRRARQAQAAQHASSYSRLMALLHHACSACSRLWSTKQAAQAETGASRDVPVVLQ